MFGCNVSVVWPLTTLTHSLTQQGTAQTSDGAHPVLSWAGAAALRKSVHSVTGSSRASRQLQRHPATTGVRASHVAPGSVVSGEVWEVCRLQTCCNISLCLSLSQTRTVRVIRLRCGDVSDINISLQPDLPHWCVLISQLNNWWHEILLADKDNYHRRHCHYQSIRVISSIITLPSQPADIWPQFPRLSQPEPASRKW